MEMCGDVTTTDNVAYTKTSRMALTTDNEIYEQISENIITTKNAACEQTNGNGNDNVAYDVMATDNVAHEKTSGMTLTTVAYEKISEMAPTTENMAYGHCEVPPHEKRPDEPETTPEQRMENEEDYIISI